MVTTSAEPGCGVNKHSKSSAAGREVGKCWVTPQGREEKWYFPGQVDQMPGAFA